jgi:hypothetical protein
LNLLDTRKLKIVAEGSLTENGWRSAQNHPSRHLHGSFGEPLPFAGIFAVDSTMHSGLAAFFGAS